MIIVGGKIAIDPQHMPALQPDIHALEAVTRTEAGCQFYAMAIDDAAAGSITVLEMWDSEAHLKTHLAQDNTKAFIAKWGDKFTEMGVKLYEVSEAREVVA